MRRNITLNDILEALSRSQLIFWAINLGLTSLTYKTDQEIRELIRLGLYPPGPLFEALPDGALGRIAALLGFDNLANDKEALVAKILEGISPGRDKNSQAEGTAGQKRYLSEVMLAAYLSEVKKSKILKPEKSPKRCLSEAAENGFAEKLAYSRTLARREFAVCHKVIMELFENMKTIETSLLNDLEIIRSNEESFQKYWKVIFEQFHAGLGNIFQYAQESLIGSFEKKARRIDHFCICLFGRTKAGKSSTMEALTAGDGSSIGIGRQNTTRDVKHYQYKGLLVVDTPGIDAMDQLDQLENMALSYADESDLIIFLMPHQIEEGDFERFSRFYKQNKPILILLNIKQDLGKKDSPEFRHFLKYNEELFASGIIGGYIQRIEDFIFSRLKISPGLIPIIPIHSKSAFLATKESDPDIRQSLRRASRFDTLEEHLSCEIRDYSELYRIKNPYDTVVLFSEVIKNEFETFDEHLSKQEILFRENIEKYKEVKSRIIQKRNQIVQRHFSEYLTAKRAAANGIVDQLFDEKNEDKRKNILVSFLSQEAIVERVQRCQKEMSSMIKEQIQEFFKTFSQQLNMLDISFRHASMSQKATRDMNHIQDLGETGDMLEGLGMISSVVLGIGSAIVVLDVGILGAAGTLFGLGSSQIWNPVGWGLLAASAVLGVWGWRKKAQMKEKLAQAKADNLNTLKSEIDKIMKDVENATKTWSDEIIATIEKEHINLMEKYASYASRHLQQVLELIRNLDFTRQEAVRRKFDSMLNRLEENKMIAVTNVIENPQQITIKVLSPDSFDTSRITKVLSRVEEKEIAIVLEGKP